ncbi:MAG: 4Fe-4S dicluster domain-containing protein [Thermodesulfobacteriota bacterium]
MLDPLASDTSILKKDHLKGFLRKLAKDHRLVAPIRNRHGDVLFSVIDDLDAAEIELVEPPQNSLKQFFLPQREVLHHYTTGPEGYGFTPAPADIPPTVYFGVHPCDLSALLYMDVVFTRRSRDPFYLRRRQSSVLIGVNCNTPAANCFCNATGSGPFLELGSDLQFTDLGDRFLVETGRIPGQALLERWQRFFSPAGDKDRAARYQAFLEARGRFQRQVHVEQAIRRLENGQVPERAWEELSLRCQDCGGCAYLCPTCTCFTISDLATDATSGQRLRSWDACTFAGFTAMAGGHNPVRPTTQAIRQRFTHKLRDDVRLNGRPSCVGCGRCVGACFGGTDIVRFVELACAGIL